MEQFMPGIVQALILGGFCVAGIYLWYRMKDMKTPAAASKPAASSSQINPPAIKIDGGFDIGVAAGSYAILFFAAAIIDAIYNIIQLNKNDLIGLLLVLDLLTVAAWIWGSRNKRMRGIATLFAVATTVMVALILIRHAAAG